MRTLLDLPPTERVGRYPKHTFNVRAMPFVIQPMMIAPVLPGETMTNLFMESRVVTDPIDNSIIGWKQEYMFFYVRMSNLLVDAIKDMFVDPNNADVAATLGIAANSTPYYTAKGGVDYLKRAIEKITTHYFRDQDEAWNVAVTADGLPIAQIREATWMDSLTDKDVMPEGAAIASATDAGDLDRLMDAFNMLRAMGMANMTYEDWLRSQGMAIPEEEDDRPELLARFSDFQYPTNSVNTSTGVPVSAVSWVFRNGERKPKLFKEPGFVVGVTVTRPKVYFSGLAGNLAAHMTRAWDWVPNYMQMMPETSLKNFPSDTGPLGDRTTAPDGYWVDMRDLLLHGDQFQNHTAFAAVPAVNGAFHMVPLPDGATFNHKYLTEAQCKSFMVDEASGNHWVKHDGYVSLGIKGLQVDFTQGNLAIA